MSYSDDQIEQLLKPINPKRVGHTQGLSHVEAYEIAAHLTRIFGFPPNWRKEIVSLECIHERSEEKGNRTGWWVVYRCQMRLWVHGEVVSDDVATGDASNQPSVGDAHDMAAKTAVSQALKRCAKDLGDQFGLSLYRKGSTGGLVGRSLAYERKALAADRAPDVEDSAPAWEAEDASNRHLAVVPQEPYYREVDAETGEVTLEPTGPAPAEERSRHPSAGVTAAERAEAIEVRMIHNGQLRRLHPTAKAAGVSDHEEIRRIGNELIGRDCASMNQWTQDEGERIIDHFKAMVTRGATT